MAIQAAVGLYFFDWQSVGLHGVDAGCLLYGLHDRFAAKDAVDAQLALPCTAMLFA